MIDLLASNGKKPRTGSVIQCRQCSMDFYWKQSPSHKPRQFCSLRCSDQSKVKGVIRHCVNCGKSYRRPPSQARLRGAAYCSMPCLWEHGKTRMAGAKNPSWKGGVSSVNRRIRNSGEYRHWREAVFKRDNWTCQKCGRRGGVALHPHHLKPFADYPALRFEVSNGMTLCADPCHRDEHRRPTNRKNGRNWRRDQTVLPI